MSGTSSHTLSTREDRSVIVLLLSLDSTAAWAWFDRPSHFSVLVQSDLCHVCYQYTDLDHISMHAACA